MGQYETSYQLYNEVINSNKLSKEQEWVTSFQRDKNIPKFKDNYLKYPKKKVENILKSLKNKQNFLTIFSITTCKRFDLFEKTMNSFINCCEDLNLIDMWICVDDNSSIEDKKKMKELYPFFRFIWKTKEQKGHYMSMNIIFSLYLGYIAYIDYKTGFIPDKVTMPGIIVVYVY